MTSTLNVIEAWDAAYGIYRATLGTRDLTAYFKTEAQPSTREKFNFEGLDIMDSKTVAFFKVKSGFATIVTG